MSGISSAGAICSACLHFVRLREPTSFRYRPRSRQMHRLTCLPQGRRWRDCRTHGATGHHRAGGGVGLGLPDESIGSPDAIAWQSIHCRRCRPCTLRPVGRALIPACRTRTIWAGSWPPCCTAPQEDLLNSYETERRPVAADMLGLSPRLLDELRRKGTFRRGREVSQLDTVIRGRRCQKSDRSVRRVCGRVTVLRMRGSVVLGSAFTPVPVIPGTHWFSAGL